MTSRRFVRDPSYRLHKQSGQAIVTLADGFGGRKDFLLGPYGTPASKAEYRRLLTEWETNGRRLPQQTAVKDISVAELMMAFWTHAEQHYRHPDGRPTSELRDFKLSLRPLKRLYGHTAAAEFGPLALKAVRQAMITASWLSPQERAKLVKKGRKQSWARGVINQRVGRIRRMFRWGVENELVPASVHQGLMAVRGLQRGRSEARETLPVRPVPVAFVEAILPHVRAQVAAMVRLQLATGMRPGEVTIMRGIDLDMSGSVWRTGRGATKVPMAIIRQPGEATVELCPSVPRDKRSSSPGCGSM
jgi:integrase